MKFVITRKTFEGHEASRRYDFIDDAGEEVTCFERTFGPFKEDKNFFFTEEEGLQYYLPGPFGATEYQNEDEEEGLFLPYGKIMIIGLSKGGNWL